MYDCGSAEHWKAEIAKAADGIIPAEPWDCPIALHLWFFMPRPKSHFHKNGKLKLTSPHWHRIKPDADNLAKAVMDAMTVMKFWLDDSQVVHLDIVKRYTDADSGCEISIQEAAQ